MTKDEAQTILNDFQADEISQGIMKHWLNEFALVCAAGSAARGFHDDEEQVQSCLDIGTYKMPAAPIMAAWMDSCILQAELARQASEIGEAIEAVRKPAPDSHCPQHSNFLIEEADTMIRIGDTCGKRDMDLGAAIVDKLLYNTTRPHKHGKLS